MIQDLNDPKDEARIKILHAKANILEAIQNLEDSKSKILEANLDEAQKKELVDKIDNQIKKYKRDKDKLYKMEQSLNTDN